MAFTKSSSDGDLLEEAFQRGVLAEPLLLAYRDLSTASRIAFQVVLRSPSPRTVQCVLLGEPRGLQPAVLHPHRLRRLVWRPTPNYEPGATGNTQGLSRRRW
nr:MAG TPA: hypothetical protein [Caudoviricetes sp.]